MQIKDLPASSALNADDVLAKDTNGITTEKITGANLAAAVKLLASLLGVSDVINSLISTSTTAPLAAAQGKALDEHIGVVQNGLTTIEINGNSTTHTGGAAQGDFVIVRNSTITGITDGLYTAAQEIPANTVIDSTYLTAVDGGGLNAVLKPSEIAKQVGTATIGNAVKNTSSVNLYKAGNVCYVSGFIITKGALAKNDILFSLPNGYIPTYGAYYLMSTETNSKQFLYRIGVSGNAVSQEAFASANGEMYYFSAIFII